MAIHLTDVGFDASPTIGDPLFGLGITDAGFDPTGPSFHAELRLQSQLEPLPDEIGVRFGQVAITNDFKPDERHRKGYAITLDGIDFSDVHLTINGSIDANRTSFKVSFAGTPFDGIDLESAAARVLVVYRWNDTGAVAQQYLMMVGTASSVQVHRGPRSTTTTVTFNGEPPAREAFFEREVQAAEYYSLSNGRYSIRLPITWAFSVGDSIQFDGGSKEVVSIKYTLSPRQEFMTVEAV